MQQPRETRPRRRSGASWIGLLVFLLLAIGPQIVNAVSQFIFQATNGTVVLGPNVIPLVIGGVIILFVVVSVVRALGNISPRRDTPFPSTGPSLPQTPSLPQGASPPQPRSTNSSLQRRANTGSDINAKHLPKAPQFEPVVDSRVLMFGILGLVVLGVVFGAAFVVVAALQLP